jgi:hypothetical protein
MKYRGYILTRRYLPGSDYKIVYGVVKPRKPTKADLDYVLVETPWGFRFHESTIKQAKQTIDHMETIK